VIDLDADGYNAVLKSEIPPYNLETLNDSKPVENPNLRKVSEIVSP
jgi:hypothetical protein